MSNAALNWAYAQRLDDPMAKFLLVTLANRLNGTTGKLYPKVGNLAADMDCAERTVKDKIEVLRALHLITTKRGQYGLEFTLEMCSVCTSGGDPEVQSAPSRSANERHPEVQSSAPPIREPEDNQKKEPEGSRPSGARRKPTPSHAIRIALETVLMPATAEAIIDHRNRLKFPLSQRAAELLARKYGEAQAICGLTPDQAADYQIERGWRAFDGQWVVNARQRDQPRTTGPPSGQTPSMSEILLREQHHAQQKTIDHLDEELPATRRAKPGGA